MADLAKLVDELSALTVMEAADLSKMLEEKWGVSAAAAVGILAVLLVDDGPAFCGFVPQKVARPRYGAVVPLLPKKKTSLISFWLKLVPTRSTLLKKSALSPSWG